MHPDPRYYVWLGLVVSWIVFPLIAIQALLRFRKEKKKSDLAIAIFSLLLFVARGISAYIR